MKIPDADAPTLSARGRVALDAVAKGYYVFPIRRGTKDHHYGPGEGWPAATNNPAKVRELWSKYPDANVGIACKPSGVAVIDPDAPRLDRRTGKMKPDGRGPWRDLARQHGWPTDPDTDTPNAGQHFYFRDPIGLSSSSGDLPPGIDVKASGAEHGGYVLAPGSFAEGGRYVGELRPVADLSEVPGSLVAVLRPKSAERRTNEPLGPPGQAAALLRECDALRAEPPGNRNRRLNQAAFNLGQLVNPELSETLVRESLAVVARDCGLEPDETTKTIDSGLRAGLAKARPTVDEREARILARTESLLIDREARRRVEEQSREQDEPGLEVDGGSFVFDIPDGVPAVWGLGTRVVWACGEACVLVGPPGVGKTTLAGQIIRGRLGLGGDVLGLPVAPTTSKVLYLAMDRPQQIARSLRRHFAPAERATVEARLVVWKGPPPADLARHPETLLELARRAGADTVVVDSLKDAAVGLSEDEVGAGYNRARQLTLAAGVEVLELHHTVKNGTNGTRPDQLKDVYGSTWLTSGAGSVLLLWGDAGDPVVDLLHLKQPAEQVGPWKVRHDHCRGRTTLEHGADPLSLLRAAGRDGLTARDFAARTEGDTDPKTVERCRRALQKMIRRDLVEVFETKTSGGKTTQHYRVIQAQQELPEEVL